MTAAVEGGADDASPNCDPAGKRTRPPPALGPIHVDMCFDQDTKIDCQTR